MLARLIAIRPMTRRDDGSTFFNYSWATLRPIGVELAEMKAQGLVTEAEIAEMAANGVDMTATAVWSMSENEALLPAYIVRHCFNVTNVKLVLARDPVTKAVIMHEKRPAEGCLNGARSSESDYPVYSYDGRRGSTTLGLPADVSAPVAPELPANVG